MEFGIAYPARPDAWKDLVIAEEHGFTQAWFYDSQMLYSDVYVCMALAAEKTKRIKLDTVEPDRACHRAFDCDDQPARARPRDPRSRHRLHRPQHDGPAADSGRAAA